ncbi:hypothetical protein [Streptococcus intermedius]|uniref:Uncharacterized protein n=1 Tax=Streptococcus intermedius TaxID=1338 RepID=A0AAD1FJL4_STRIT|nr:hypothetical protein [Streptococcus intermedius]RSJ20514.1 hypothetical protein D8828_09075 [Streptococcus intermedius]BAW16995.1 hypothetical protein SITYG_10150 [Streptococcus intermedius]
MQTNNMLELARETRKKIRKVFTDKVDTITAYDIVDEPNHHTFKLNFEAYNYFWIEFDYENDWCEFFIVLNEACKQSLYNRTKFSEITDWDAYLSGIMKEIELRIPDKFLKAKGWL